VLMRWRNPESGVILSQTTLALSIVPEMLVEGGSTHSIAQKHPKIVVLRTHWRTLPRRLGGT
ncbi:MAG: hypothetical protein QW613_04930, partial [Thermoprotei archaeon]